MIYEKANSYVFSLTIFRLRFKHNNVFHRKQNKYVKIVFLTVNNHVLLSKILVSVARNPAFVVARQGGGHIVKFDSPENWISGSNFTICISFISVIIYSGKIVASELIWKGIMVLMVIW